MKPAALFRNCQVSGPPKGNMTQYCPRTQAELSPLTSVVQLAWSSLILWTQTQTPPVIPSTCENLADMARQGSQPEDEWCEGSPTPSHIPKSGRQAGSTSIAAAKSRHWRSQLRKLYQNLGARFACRALFQLLLSNVAQIVRARASYTPYLKSCGCI